MCEDVSLPYVLMVGYMCVSCLPDVDRHVARWTEVEETLQQPELGNEGPDGMI